MKNITFSVSSLIESGWSRFKESALFWVGITILISSVSAFSDYGVSFTPDTFETNFNPVGLLVSIVSTYLSASVTLMTINYMRGKMISTNDLIVINFNTFLNYFLVTIVSGILILIALLFLIVPGIYVATRLIFAQYLVVDKNLSFDEAIKTSWKMSEGNVLNFIAFYFAMFFLLLLGLLCLVVGVLVAAPVVMLATAALYVLFANNMTTELE